MHETDRLRGARRFAPLFLTAALFAPLLALVLTDTGTAEAAEQFVFEGGGWGHGVGMSQYGAYGMAKLDGAGSSDILTHYFTGTSLKTLGSDLPEPAPLWVNLLREASLASISAEANRSGGTPITIVHGDWTAKFSSGAKLTIEVTGEADDGSPICTLSLPGTEPSVGTCMADLRWDGDAASPTTRAVLGRVRAHPDTGSGTPCTLADWNVSPTRFRPCSYARGSLHLRPDNNTPSFHLLVEIDLEDYLLGISEMPYGWGLPAEGPNGQAALEAQVVAARSYAIHRQIDRGNPENRPWCWCHVYDTAVDQNYVGWGHSGRSQPRWLQAVKSTAHQVLVHPKETKGGKQIPIEAFYGSSTFGRTEPSSIIFGQSRSYLQSVDDHWALEPGVRNPRATWSKSFTPAALARSLGWGTDRSVASVAIISCSPSGAADEVRFIDTSGAIEIRRARTLRALLGLRSPQITRVGAPPQGPPNCGGLGDETPGLRWSAVDVDDDAEGDSAGNGDGITQCGETVELHIGLTHGLTGRLNAVRADLATEDPHVTILHNTTSAYPSIGDGAVAENADDWDVEIAPDAPAGHAAAFTVTVSATQGGPWVLEVEVPIECASAGAETGTDGIQLSGLTVDDGIRGDSIGNNDRRAQCGETIELYAGLTNNTGSPLAAVEATLVFDDPHLTLLHNTSSGYRDLASDETVDNLNDWDIAIAAEVPPGHVAALELEVTTPSGDAWTLASNLSIDCGAVTEAEAETPGRVTVASVTVDDGPKGDSRGNFDRRAQCGEHIELYVGLHNGSGAVLEDVVAVLRIEDDHLTILHNLESDYPALPASDALDNRNDWDIAVAASTPADHKARLVLAVRAAGGGSWEVPFEVEIECAPPPQADLSVSSVTVDDGIRGDSRGNNDGLAACGETIELYVAIENGTAARMAGVGASLVTSDPHLTLLYNDTSSYPDLAAGAAADNGNDWDMRVAADTPDGHAAAMSLTVSDAGGGVRELAVPLTISCQR